MPDTLDEPTLASEPPRTALAEIRSTRDDFSQFFGDVFDQLQTLSLELFARHKCLEAAVPTTDSADVPPTFVTEFRAHIERCLDQLRRTQETLQAHANGWQQTHADMDSMRKQIGDEFIEVQSVRLQVAAMAGQFEEIKSDLRQHHKALAHLSERVESQFAQMAETLNQQFYGAPPAHGPPEHRSHAPVDNAVLNSVLAEVEFIHHDAAARRNGHENRRE